MPIMPIDNVRHTSRVMPVQAVQPVHRSQAVGPRFQLPTSTPRSRQNERKLSAGRSIVVHEEGYVRRYGLLPDGTRILISEEPESSAHPFPLPHHEAPPILHAESAEDEPNPEQRMKASSQKLKALLGDRKTIG
ncbi:hypothetical protein B9G55_18080 [Saccharibacillus sp. O16]|nr:hypothetical protein B9G55_18080 [Saccharibacillus sp. O16]